MNNVNLETLIQQVLNEIKNGVAERPEKYEDLKKKIVPKTSKLNKLENGVIEISNISELNHKIISGFYITVENGKMSVNLIKVGQSISLGELTNIKTIDELNAVFELIGVKTRVVLKAKKEFIKVKDIFTIINSSSVSNLGGYIYIDSRPFVPEKYFQSILGKTYEVVSKNNAGCYIIKIENDKIAISDKLKDKAYTLYEE